MMVKLLFSSIYTYTMTSKFCTATFMGRGWNPNGWLGELYCKMMLGLVFLSSHQDDETSLPFRLIQSYRYRSDNWSILALVSNGAWFRITSETEWFGWNVSVWTEIWTMVPVIYIYLWLLTWKDEAISTHHN